MTRMLTIEDAAVELGVSYCSVWRLIDTGKLRAIKYPGVRRKLIDRADLEAFIERSKTPLKPSRKEAA